MSQRYETLVSPAGKIKYSNIHKPNKFGNFSVDLVVEPNEATAFQEKLKALSEAARDQLIEEAKPTKGKTKQAVQKELQGYTLHVIGKPDTDANGEPTGNTLFTFTNKAEGKKKDGSTFKVRIDAVDAKRNKMVAAKIGRGSLVKVAFQVVPFAMASTKLIGVSGRLQAVQVKELVEYTGGASAAFAEEDGYQDDGEPVNDSISDDAAPEGSGSDADY
jgi:hypothetical protein